MKNLFIGSMSKTSRILVGLASLLLVCTYFFPLWKIGLWAPQYPEGLSLFIWADKLSGDVQTVNVLNHYIGMSPIEAEKFPELLLFPKIFAGLILLGAVTTAIGKKALSSLWFASLMGFAVWALYDFYNWEYQFGRNLNPDAPMKMEDMVYQPPLIGEKTFLNITATSLPELAGYGFMMAILFATVAVVLDLRMKNNYNKV